MAQPPETAKGGKAKARECRAERVSRRLLSIARSYKTDRYRLMELNIKQK